MALFTLGVFVGRGRVQLCGVAGLVSQGHGVLSSSCKSFGHMASQAQFKSQESTLVC